MSVVTSGRRTWPVLDEGQRNFVGMGEQKLVANQDVPVGERLILSASCAKDGEDPPGVATGSSGRGRRDQGV
jgi:hypothetical protein